MQIVACNFVHFFMNVQIFLSLLSLFQLLFEIVMYLFAFADDVDHTPRNAHAPTGDTEQTQESTNEQHTTQPETFEVDDRILKLLAQEARLAAKERSLGSGLAVQENELRFSIWDLAGQTLYHETAHMLLTK